MTAMDVVRKKGESVHSISPQSSVLEALTVMNEKNIGALLVLEHGLLVGVVSERDCARKILLQERLPQEVRVRDIMTSEPVCIQPDTDIRECMRLMTDHQIRHLPMISGTKVRGVLSIGDVVKSVIEDQEDWIHHLQRYIIGR